MGHHKVVNQFLEAMSFKNGEVFLCKCCFKEAVNQRGQCYHCPVGCLPVTCKVLPL